MRIAHNLALTFSIGIIGAFVFVAMIAGASPADIKGDMNCDGSVNPIDSLILLRHDAGLTVNLPAGCEPIGSTAAAAAPSSSSGDDKGDMNCDGSVNPIDSLVLLRHDAGLTVNLPAGCDPIGSTGEPDLTFSELIIEPDWRDFGDAPDGTETGYAGGAPTGSFPTQPEDGPSHPFPFTVWLGEFATVEPEPYVGMDADDGLQILDLAACDDSSALLMINRGGLSEPELDDPVYLNLLADWNKDGDWSDADGCAPEWAVQNLQLDLSESGPNLEAFVIDFTGGDQVDEFWLRLVISREPFDPVVGGEFEGETEDYFITGDDLVASAARQPSSPVTQAALAGSAFICEGAVVPHSGAFATFEVRQTRASKKLKFTPNSFDNPSISRPRSEDGKRASGVDATELRIISSTITGGLATLKFETLINSTVDDPQRLEGPFILSMLIQGTDTKGAPFSGSLPCAFYVDHSATATTFWNNGTYGFRGGPGRTGTAKSPDGPEFIEVIHGGKEMLRSDGPVFEKPAVYDASATAVFDGKGNLVATSDVKKVAGIRTITPTKNGRGFVFQTFRDKHDPTVERIIIRFQGMAGGQSFLDYYRLLIIHTSKSKWKRLVDLYNESHALQVLEEDERFAVSYGVNGAAIHSLIPPGGGLEWNVETVCEVSSGGSLGDLMRGSRAFVFEYDEGGSDIFMLPDQDGLTQISGQVADDCNDAINVTGFGVGSSFTIEGGSICDDTVYATEFGPGGSFGAFKAGVPPASSSPQPISGGEDMRYVTCFNVDGECQPCLLGSSPGPGDTSDIVILETFGEICGGTCTQSSHLPTVLLEPDNPGEHLINAVVSPDNTKIAFEYVSSDDVQVYVGDFDPHTPAISNAAAVTSEGFNGSPTWSSDSQQLAFLSNRDGNLEIYVMNADGSDQQNITNTPNVSEHDPSWQVP